MKNTLCWTDIPVANLDRATAFYSALLNASVEKQAAGNGATYALLPWAEGVVSGCLYVADDNAPSAKGPLVYLSVEGRLDDAVKVAEQKGGGVVQAKHQIGPHGFRALVFDSEGNRLALHSMKP